MVASDLYALKGLWLKETLKDFKKLRKLKNEARLYMGNQSTVEPLPTSLPLKLQVPKEVFGSFKISHVVANKLSIT